MLRGETLVVEAKHGNISIKVTQHYLTTNPSSPVYIVHSYTIVQFIYIHVRRYIYVAWVAISGNHWKHGVFEEKRCMAKLLVLNITIS